MMPPCGRVMSERWWWTGGGSIDPGRTVWGSVTEPSPRTGEYYPQLVYSSVVGIACCLALANLQLQADLKKLRAHAH